LVKIEPVLVGQVKNCAAVSYRLLGSESIAVKAKAKAVNPGNFRIPPELPRKAEPRIRRAD
jgi:hypothetical protein